MAGRPLRRARRALMNPQTFTVDPADFLRYLDSLTMRTLSRLNEVVKEFRQIDAKRGDDFRGYEYKSLPSVVVMDYLGLPLTKETDDLFTEALSGTPPVPPTGSLGWAIDQAWEQTDRYFNFIYSEGY